MTIRLQQLWSQETGVLLRMDDCVDIGHAIEYCFVLGEQASYTTGTEVMVNGNEWSVHRAFAIARQAQYRTPTPSCVKSKLIIPIGP